VVLLVYFVQPRMKGENASWTCVAFARGTSLCGIFSLVLILGGVNVSRKEEGARRILANAQMLHKLNTITVPGVADHRNQEWHDIDRGIRDTGEKSWNRYST
jgi:hypothetical protein